MLKSKEHIRHFLLYEWQLGHKAAEAHRNICHAKGKNAVSNVTTSRWFERFRNKKYSLEDELKSGRPTTIDLSDLQKAIETDPTLTTRDVAATLRCSISTVNHWYKVLRLSSRLGEWLPHDLTPTHKKKRVDTCRFLLSSHRTFICPSNVITVGEKSVLYANIERKRHRLKPGDKPARTPKTAKFREKRMVSVWWDAKGVLYL